MQVEEDVGEVPHDKRRLVGMHGAVLHWSARVHKDVGRGTGGTPWVRWWCEGCARGTVSVWEVNSDAAWVREKAWRYASIRLGDITKMMTQSSFLIFSLLSNPHVLLDGKFGIMRCSKYSTL